MSSRLSISWQSVLWLILVALLPGILFSLEAHAAGGTEGVSPKDRAHPALMDAYDRPAPALVMLHNRPIVLFRSRVLGADPVARAERVGKGLKMLLSQKSIGEVSTRTIPEGTVFLVGGKVAFLISNDEMSPEFGETPEEVLGRAKRNLELAIAEVMEGRDPKVLIKASAISVLATILLLLILYGLNRLRRRINTKATEYGKKLAITTQSRGLFLTESLFSFTRWVINVSISLGGAGFIYTWLTFCLGLFPQSRAVADRLGGYLSAIFLDFGSGILSALPGLAVIALIIMFSRLLTSVLKTLFKSIEEGRISFTWFDPEVARPTFRILTGIVWLFALIMAYPYMPGSGSAAFKGVSVFAGLVLTLGSTNFVNQAASGLVLMYARAFKAPDYIRVGETEGTVVHLGILSTRIKTPKGEEVTIPNGVMVSNTMRNFSRLAGGKGALLLTGVTIGYSTPWRKVHELLLMAAKATPEIASEPAPFVRQKALSDFYVEYELVAVAQDPTRRSAVLSDLHGNIQDTFNQFEEQIMSPHYVADPSEKVIVPKQKWYFSTPVEEV